MPVAVAFACGSCLYMLCVQGDSDTGEDGEYLSVELERGSRGFGFSIRGGREFHNMPLFVLRIAEGGPAHHHTKLKVTTTRG